MSTNQSMGRSMACARRRARWVLPGLAKRTGGENVVGREKCGVVSAGILRGFYWAGSIKTNDIWTRTRGKEKLTAFFTYL